MAKTHNLLSLQLRFTFAIVAAFFAVSQGANAFPIRLGLSPDNDQGLLISTLKSAQQELVINMYQFDSPAIAQTVIDQIEAGVTVRILLEGQPVGKISASGTKVMNAIIDAMARSRNRGNQFFLMTSKDESDKAQAKRRYRFDHAKYVVIDSKEALVTSENFTATGHADPGHKGNRGWETVVSDPALAKQLLGLFETDTDTSYGDIELEKVRRIAGAAIPADDHPGERRQARAIPVSEGEADAATLVDSPNSLPGLTSFIQSARKHLELEQMSLPSNWRESEVEQSPLINEIIESARRGVSVRVLLNDEDAFGGGQTGPDAAEFQAESFHGFDWWPWGTEDTSAPKKKPNVITMELLNHVADCENLDLEARIVDIKEVGITYIHNKGALADGRRALVSSINGTRNAVMNNRETAVVLDSEDAATYFGGAFDFDWTSSAVKRPKTGPKRKCTKLDDL